MKKVLFIAYHFPPIAGGGTFRSLKFVKYLPEFGWQPTVITTNNKLSFAYDNNLLNEIPKDIKIIRTNEFNLFILHIIFSKFGLGKFYDIIKDKFFIPDSKIGWIPNAIKKSKIELKLQKYDLIFSTSPTICSHIIAMKLSKKFNIPWVCDFRDYWTLHSTYSYTNTLRGEKEKKLEKNILQEAKTLTTVSNGVSSDFIAQYNFLKNKVSVITNGYDIEKTFDTVPQSHFTICYTGSFYGEYTPVQFTYGLNQLIEENPKLKNLIQIEYIGNISQEIQDFIRKTSLTQTQIKPFQSQKDIENIIENSSVLLLILPGKKHYGSYIPTKLFSYLIYNKPILAIIPDGETKSILNKSNLGYFADPNSVDDIKNQILNMYNLWKENKLNPKPNMDYIKQFHRHNLTKQLVEVFESII